jgi:hypothetical protein
MICQGCKSGFHEGCRGGTWCDCQHRASAQVRASGLKVIAQDHEILARLQDNRVGDHGPAQEFVVKGGLRFPPILIAVPEGRDPDDFAQELNAALSHDRSDL